MEQKRTERNDHVCVGVDSAYRDFPASLLQGARTTREPHPYPQTASGFERFQKRLEESGVLPSDTLIVMEATGSDWVALATTLSQAGFAVSVIHPVQAHHVANAQRKRAKNDGLDAQTMAALAHALVPACWTPPPRISQELHQRLAQRASLLEWRTQINHHLHALSGAPEGVPPVRNRLLLLRDQLNQHVAEREKELREIVEQEGPCEKGELQSQIVEPETIEKPWKAAIALLLTIPGVGLLTACWLVVATLNVPLCETAEAATHSVGLAPLVRSSGTSVRGHAQIGHGGHTRARTPLYLATFAAARLNPVINAFYEHLRETGTPMKVARCACARTLLQSAFAIVPSKRAFDPHDQSSPLVHAAPVSSANNERNETSRGETRLLLFCFPQAQRRSPGRLSCGLMAMKPPFRTPLTSSDSLIRDNQYHIC
jgi:transposase